MGRTIKAKLHYGYSLGDEENGWEFAELDTDEDGYGNTPTMPWWDEDGDGDLADQAMTQLLAAVGFIESDWRADGYYDRRHEAESKLGVKFECTGYEGGMLLLVAADREFHAYSGDCTELVPSAMTADAAADEALANALRVLGITPKQEKPAWLLTCYYG